MSKSGLVWVHQEMEADAKTEDIQEVWGGCEGKGEANGEAGRVSDCTRSDACRGGATEEVGGIVAHTILTELGLSRPVQSPQTRTTHPWCSPQRQSERCMFMVASRREPGLSGEGRSTWV